MNIILKKTPADNHSLEINDEHSDDVQLVKISSHQRKKSRKPANYKIRNHNFASNNFSSANV
jgi:hypothetical protein